MNVISWWASVSPASIVGWTRGQMRKLLVKEKSLISGVADGFTFVG